MNTGLEGDLVWVFEVYGVSIRKRAPERTRSLTFKIKIPPQSLTEETETQDAQHGFMIIN